MKKVADWQIRTARRPLQPAVDVRRAVRRPARLLQQTGDPTAHDAVLRMAERFQWQLDRHAAFLTPTTKRSARPTSISTSNIPIPERIAATKATLDRLIARPDEAKPVWWWCDALFMAPPVLVRMSKDHRRPQIHRLHGPRVAHHREAALRRRRASLLPRRPLPRSRQAARSQRQKDLLVARQRLGCRRSGQHPRVPARERPAASAAT